MLYLDDKEWSASNVLTDQSNRQSAVLALFGSPITIFEVETFEETYRFSVQCKCQRKSLMPNNKETLISSLAAFYEMKNNFN